MAFTKTGAPEVGAEVDVPEAPELEDEGKEEEGDDAADEG